MAYVLGVDGGGTRTVCILADLEGTIFGEGESGPSNFQTVGVVEAVEAIRRAIEGAAANVPSFSFPVESICLGLAGVDTPQDEALLREQIESLHVARQVCVVNDTEIALIGGVGGERGVVVVAGTGSAAFGCDGEGRKARAGGWGWILGDEGSGFDVGQGGLRAVVRALEGRGPATALVEVLMRQWKLASRQELAASLRARSWTRRDVASLAEWVSEAASEGDSVARGIITRAGEELGLLAATVIEQLQLRGEFSIVLTGGVFRAGEMVSEPLWRKVYTIAPEVRLMPSIRHPALGAIFMAWRKLGLPLDAERMERAHAMAHARRRT